MLDCGEFDDAYRAMNSDSDEAALISEEEVEASEAATDEGRETHAHQHFQRDRFARAHVVLRKR